jgi:hypothetical protein
MTDTNAVGSLFTSTLSAKKAGKTAPAGSSPSFSGLLGAIEARKDVTPKAVTTVKAQTPEEKFLKYQNMTPAEKLRASYLSQMGISEDQLKAMDPIERAKVEAKIAEKIREQMAEATGIDAKDTSVASAGVAAITSGAAI